MRRPAFWDVVCLLVIFAGGAVIGSRYIDVFQRSGGTEEFGQPEFGAAVMLACGRGFVDPVAPTPALAAFLARKADSVSCGDLPAGMRTGQPNFTQKLYRYLMAAVALEWKWSGVSWSKLTPLFALTFAVTLCIAYALFRLAGGPLVGMLGVAPLAVSAHSLGMLPSLRDYAKAPFILVLILLMARMALPPYSRAKALGFACLFGLALGIGFGFRNDILISVPPFLLVVAFLLPVTWREELGVKAGCVALAALVFVGSAWPVLRAYRSGSNTGHVAVLGLMSSFDGPMALTRPPYDIGTHYLDGYADVLISTHSYLHTGKFVEYLAPEYDQAAFGLITDAIRHWPADIFVRGIGATLRVLDFPFSVGRFSPPDPAGITSSAVLSFYDAQMSLLRALSGLGPLLVALSIVMIGSQSVPGGIGLLLLTIYYCGYPAVQFHVRHFFHLEFIAWWALVFVMAAFCRAIRARIGRQPLAFPLKQRAVNSLAVTGALAAVLIAPLSVLRVYQQYHVPRLLQSYADARRTPMMTTRRADGDHAAITIDGLWNGRRGADTLTVKYLVAEFSAADCGAADVPVTLKYDTAGYPNDFTTMTRIAIDRKGPTYQFAPVFYNGNWSHFSEIQIPSGYDSCLKSVSVIDDLRAVAVPVDFRLTPQAARTAWFQRLANWENSPTSADPLVAARPANLIAPSEQRLASVPRLKVLWMTRGVSAAPDGRGWTVSVKASVAESHLLQFPPQEIPAGTVLRATGVLRRGGLQIGILDDDTWLDMQGVDSPGPFTVLVRTPRAGHFGALVTDYSTREWRIEPVSLLRRASRYVAPWLLQDDFDLYDIEWLMPGA